MAAKPATFYLKLNDTQPALRVQLTVDRFRPVERIAYGLVGLVLVAVVGALLKLVVA
jgi:hypothetical protein